MVWGDNIPNRDIKPRAPTNPKTAEELLRGAWPDYDDRKARWEFQAARSSTSRSYRKDRGR